MVRVTPPHFVLHDIIRSFPVKAHSLLCYSYIKQLYITSESEHYIVQYIVCKWYGVCVYRMNNVSFLVFCLRGSGILMQMQILNFSPSDFPGDHPAKANSGSDAFFLLTFFFFFFFPHSVSTPLLSLE